MAVNWTTELIAKSQATRARNMEAKRVKTLVQRNRAEKMATRMQYRLQSMLDQIKVLRGQIENLTILKAAGKISGMAECKRLPDAGELVAMAHMYGEYRAEMSGVYFLIQDHEIVYVGQSVNIPSRMTAHKDKQFNYAVYIPTAIDRLDIVESMYIHTIKPKLNGAIGGANRLNQLHAPLSSTEVYRRIALGDAHADMLR